MISTKADRRRPKRRIRDDGWRLPDALYTRREDNIFWRWVGEEEDGIGHIEAAGTRALSARDGVPLGPDIIHSVTNLIPPLTGTIHVYGGDFFNAEKSE